MGRKRLPPEEKKITFHLNITKKVIDEFKKEMEEKQEIPSRIIEKLIKEFLEEIKKDI